MKDTFNREAKALQPRLSDIQETLAKDRVKSLAISRIRYCQFSVLVNRYREIISSHYAKETHYVEKLKEQIQRQTELAGLHLQEEDIKQLVRHQQLLDLEAQICELHSLFLHLEILVLEQQEVLNSIEYNILHTTDYISQSNEEVKKAIKYERHSVVHPLVSAPRPLCLLHMPIMHGNSKCVAEQKKMGQSCFFQGERETPLMTKNFMEPWMYIGEEVSVDKGANGCFQKAVRA
ncbi:hypothetical protein E2320_012957 [Naja naja]|nr:hypothetical protein E2320_012957 [Naja naja]